MEQTNCLIQEKRQQTKSQFDQSLKLETVKIKPMFYSDKSFHSENQLKNLHVHILKEKKKEKANI